MNEDMTPKIIHQTGPTDISRWHPLWFKCQETWKTKFSDFEYRFWNDEDIDDLILTYYPEYYQMYSEFPVHILKIDFVRLVIMHRFGGIYADLDFYCYQNFYDSVKSNDVCLLENPFGNDPIENSLFCSKPNHPFWIDCMNEVQTRYNETKRFRKKNLEDIKIISSDKQYGLKFRPHLIFHLTGTNLISSVYRAMKHKYNIKTLSGRLFNNNDTSYFPEIITRHIHTGVWGKENQDIIENDKSLISLLRNIPIDTFDFYLDYSNGEYIKSDEQLIQMLNWDKNSVEPLPYNVTSEFTYE